jgi:hypothetical protein
MNHITKIDFNYQNWELINDTNFLTQFNDSHWKVIEKWSDEKVNFNQSTLFISLYQLKVNHFKSFQTNSASDIQVIPSQSYLFKINEESLLLVNILEFPIEFKFYSTENTIVTQLSSLINDELNKLISDTDISNHAYLKKDSKHQLLLNPVKQYLDVLDGFLTEIKALELNLSVINEYKINSYYLSIYTMFPLLGEAYVNLLLFVLAKKEYRHNPRLYDNLINQPYLVKIKTLHLNCEGFLSGLVNESNVVKSFVSLMKKHADNFRQMIDPKQMMCEELQEVYIKPAVFLAKNNYLSSKSLYFKVNFNSQLAFQSVQIIKDFITYSITLLKESEKTKLMDILESDFLVYALKEEDVFGLKSHQLLQQ